MKLLNGKELAEYIKERQAHEVRALRQAWHMQPKLVTDAGWPKDLVKEVQEYGGDILVDVEVGQAGDALERAEVMAILWLLAGYNIDLQSGRQVLLVGQNLALEKELNDSGVNVSVVEPDTPTLKDEVLAADVIIVNAAQPNTLFPNMLRPRVVVVDASGGDSAIAQSVYDRDDVSVTPPVGGLPPLVVCALFEGVIRTDRQKAMAQNQES